MSCDVHHSREYWLRGKRCGRIVQTLNDDQNADDLRDSVTESVDNVIQFEAYTSTLTPLQQRIAELRDIGYSDREISAICGIPYKVVALEMEGAKRSILEVYIGDAPRLEENLLCRIWVIAALKTHAVICSTVWMPYASISR